MIRFRRMRILCALLALAALCTGIATADVLDEAATAAQGAEVPSDLASHEAEIYRQGYELVYYAALHPVAVEDRYVLNAKSRKFHLPTCSAAAAMLPKNRQVWEGTRDEVIAMGYKPCGICNP